MSVRLKKKIHPALKHGGYSVTGLLPGEEQAAFDRLYEDLIAELRPDGPLENDAVRAIARLTWRKQNLDTLRKAESARKRYSAIESEKVPSSHIPLLDWEEPDPEAVKAGVEAAKAQAQKELGDAIVFVEMGEAATFERMLRDLEIEERLDNLIEKQIKRLLAVKALKSLSSSAAPASLPRIAGPQRAA
jgi:hypothetical protein